MTDGFDENVPQKLPATRQRRVPVRPWDVQPEVAEKEKPADKFAARAHKQQAGAVAEGPPMLTISEAKEPSKKMVREILRELTSKDKKPEAAPPTSPTTPLPPEPGEEVIVASDNSMLIEQESSEVLEEIDNLEAELDNTLSIQHQVEEDIGRLRDEHDELLRAKEELENQIETLKAVEELESNLKAAEEENKLALGKIRELEVTLDDSIGQQAQLSAELESTHASLEQMTDMRDAAVKQSDSERVKNAALDKKIGEMTEDRRRLRESIAALETSCEDLAVEIKEVTAKSKEFEDKLNKARKETEEEKQKIKYLENAVESYAVVKATLESDLNAARTALKSIRNRLAAVTTLMKKKPQEA